MATLYLLVTLVCCSMYFGSAHASSDTIFGSSNVTEVRLVGGNSCSGRVEIRPTTLDQFGQACDNGVTNTEATVICRQLGCSTEEAAVVPSTEFGFSSSFVNVYRAFGLNCRGTESSLAMCTRRGGNCNADDAGFAVAVRCGSTKLVAKFFTVGLIALLCCAVKWI